MAIAGKSVLVSVVLARRHWQSKQHYLLCVLYLTLPEITGVQWCWNRGYWLLQNIGVSQGRLLHKQIIQLFLSHLTLFFTKPFLTKREWYKAWNATLFLTLLAIHKLLAMQILCMYRVRLPLNKRKKKLFPDKLHCISENSLCIKQIAQILVTQVHILLIPRLLLHMKSLFTGAKTLKNFCIQAV